MEIDCDSVVSRIMCTIFLKVKLYIYAQINIYLKIAQIYLFM